MAFETTPSPIKTATSANVCDFKLWYRDVIVRRRNQKPNMIEQIPNTLDYIKSEYHTNCPINREETIWEVILNLTSISLHVSKIISPYFMGHSYIKAMKKFGTHLHNIGRASICAEITRSLEYCFHYIRNVIAIFKSEKILFQLDSLTLGVFDYTSSVYSLLQCYKVNDIGEFYDSIYMLYWYINFWIKTTRAANMWHNWFYWNVTFRVGKTRTLFIFFICCISYSDFFINSTHACNKTFT